MSAMTREDVLRVVSEARAKGEIPDLREANLGGADLREADLRGANLRGANLGEANLRGASLGGADLRGTNLGGADLRGASLRGADLGGTNLGGADLREANLGGADLRGASLRGADLGGASLGGANLGGTNLGGADLREADLRGAIGLPEAPAVPDLEARMAETCSRPEALDMSSWHSCETTHCRAGWAITFAGEAGAALEKELGPEVAGTLIYMASTPDRYVPNFYCEDHEALDDIMKRAEAAKQTEVSK